MLLFKQDINRMQYGITHYNKKPVSLELVILIDKSVKSNSSSSKEFKSNTLRGGGSYIPCGKKQQKDQSKQTQIQLPSNFAANLKHHSKSIFEKSNETLDNDSNQILNTSIQWFIFNKYYLNQLVYNMEIAYKYQEKILDAVTLIIQTLPTFINFSIFLCHDILQIVNELLRFIVYPQFMSTLLNNNNIKAPNILVNDLLQKKFLDIITQAECGIKSSNKNIWKTGIIFELKMAKAAIQNFKTNEGETVFTKLVKTTFQSIKNGVPSGDFFSASFDAGKYLFCLAKAKLSKKKYQIYFFFEEIKWFIIKEFLERKNSANSDIIEQSLYQAYKQYIQKTNHWFYHFCWVRLLSDLIFYRPLVEKRTLFQSMGPYEQNQYWDEGISKGYLHRTQFSQDICQVVFNQKNKKDRYHGYMELESFQNRLMYKGESPTKEDTFKSLLDYVKITSFSDQPELDLPRIINIILFGNPNINFLKFNVGRLSQLIKKKRNINEAKSQDLNKANNDLIQSIILCQETYNQLCLLQKQTKSASNLLNKKLEKWEESFEEETKCKFDKFSQQDLEDNETIKTFLDYLKDQLEKQKIQENKLSDDFENLKDAKSEQFFQFQELLGEIFQFPIYKKYIKWICQEYLKIINQNETEEEQIKKLINLLDGLTQVLIKILQYCQYINRQAQILMDNQKTYKQQQDQKQQNESIKCISNYKAEEMKMILQYHTIFSASKLYDPDKLDDIITTISQDIKVVEKKYNDSFGRKFLQFATKIKLKLSKLKCIENVENQLEEIKTILLTFELMDKEFQLENPQINPKRGIEKTLTMQELNQNEDQNNITKELKEKEQAITQFIETIQKYVEELKNYQEYLQYNQVGDEEIQTYIKTRIDKFQKDTLREIEDDKYFVLNLTFGGAQKYESIFLINFFESISNIFNEHNSSDPPQYTRFGKKPGLLKLETSDHYKVRECLFFNILKGQIIIEEQTVFKFCQLIIQQLWMEEKNQNVRKIFKDKEMIDQQKRIYSHELNSFSKKLLLEFREKLKGLQKLEAEIQHEGLKNDKSQLKQQLEQKSKEFQDYLNNIEEMSSQINLSFVFLQEIHKDFTILQKKIDKIQLTVDEILVDVRFFRGKRYNQLLDIRKKKVLYDQQIIEMNSIYIELRTNKRTYESTSDQENSKYNQKDQMDNSYFLVEKEVQSDLQDQSDQPINRGDVNQFLSTNKNGQQNNFDVMVIRGQAGQGKSRAAKKIEEFIWRQYDENPKYWIPIFISLPSLKDPKANLFNEALESGNYHFDKLQIKDFKDAICNEDVKVVFILDSYDELKDDVKKQNLYQTNEFKQQFNIQTIGKNVKLIITTRSEILQEKNFLRWFTGSNIKFLLDIELREFTNDQRANYLQQYSILSIKKKIFGLYEYVQQIEGKKVDPDEVGKILKEIEPTLMTCQNEQTQQQQQKNSIVQEHFLTTQKAELILATISKIPYFCYLKDEQKTIFKKELVGLWSQQKYQDSIENLQMENILTTPYIMEIFVQVLPNFAKIYSEASQLKEIFKQNFMIIKKQEQISQNKIHHINNNDQQQNSKQLDLFVERLDKIQFFKNFSILDNLNQIQYKDLTEEEKKVVISAFKLKKFTIYEFYQNFIQFYHQEQITKQYRLGNVNNFESLSIDLWDFSESLALDMTVNDQTYFSHQVQGLLKLQKAQECIGPEQNWSDQYFNGEQEQQKYKKLIRSCILLSCKGNVYSFTHKSIQEFFVSKYIVNLFEKIEKNKLQLQDLQVSLYNKDNFNISKTHFLKISEFITKLYQINEEKIVDQLKYVLKESKKVGKLERAASNSIFLLSQFKTYMGGQDLQNIHIKDTKINGLSFFDSDLSYSTFENVEVDGCNFNLSTITQGDWSIICNEQRTLSGHDNKKITSLLMHPKDEILYSCGEDQTIVVWNLSKREQKKKLINHSNIINCLAISQDGNYLASGGTDNKIQIWDNLELINTIEDHQGSVNSLYFSQDQKILASASSDKLVLLIKEYQKKNRILHRRIEHNEQVMQVVVFHDQKMAATRCSDCTVTIWNIEKVIPDIIRVFFKQPEPITCIALSQEGAILMAGIKKDQNSGSACIKAFEINPEYYQTREPINQKFPIFSLAISAKNTLVVAGSEDEIIYWKKLDFIDPIKIQCQGKIIALDISDDDKYLLSLNSKNKIELWDLQKKGKSVKYYFLISVLLIGFINNKNFVAIQTNYDTDVERDLDMIQNYEITKHEISEQKECIYLQDVVTAGKISKKSSRIFLGFENGIIKIWRRDEKLLTDFNQQQDREIIQISISSDESTLISIYEDQSIKIWDVNNCQCINTLEDLQQPIEQLQIYLSTVIFIFKTENKDDIIRVYDPYNNEIIKDFSGYSGEIHKLVFSQDNQILLFNITNQLGENKIGIITFLEESKQFKGDGCDISQIVFSQENDKLFAGIGVNQSVNIWDYQDHKLQESPISQKLQITSVVITKDQHLITGQEDGSIILWQKKDQEVIKMFEGHQDLVLDLFFSPDGLTLISCSEKEVFIWDVNKNKKITTIKQKANQVLFYPTYPQEQRILLKTNDKIVIWDIIQDQAKELPSFCQQKQQQIVINSQIEIAFQQQQNIITSIDISKIDQQIVCCLSNGDIQLLSTDKQSWTKLTTSHTSKVNCICFQPCISSQVQQNTIVSASDDKTIFIWKQNDEFYNLYKQLDDHKSEVKVLTFTSKGEYLASGDSNGYIFIWETKAYEIYKKITGGAEIVALAFSPLNNILAFGITDRLIKLWNIKDEKTIQKIQVINEIIGSIVFSIDSILAYSHGTEISLCSNQYKKIMNKKKLKNYISHFKILQKNLYYKLKTVKQRTLKQRTLRFRGLKIHHYYGYFNKRMQK